MRPDRDRSPRISTKLKGAVTYTEALSQTSDTAEVKRKANISVSGVSKMRGICFVSCPSTPVNMVAFAWIN